MPGERASSQRGAEPPTPKPNPFLQDEGYTASMMTLQAFPTSPDPTALISRAQQDEC